ncbi:hypothetical protein FACS1894132_05950 [Clostridia bacterium]|nr:hypothetical protein FACS1894132_05950 [Clostridia bacterium]
MAETGLEIAKKKLKEYVDHIISDKQRIENAGLHKRGFQNLIDDVISKAIELSKHIKDNVHVDLIKSNTDNLPDDIVNRHKNKLLIAEKEKEITELEKTLAEISTH